MTKTKSQSDKISLEDYLLLIQSRSTLHLTVTQLNQIIRMHGFKKLHRIPKKGLREAVSTLDLVEPRRSTLRDYISPVVHTCPNDVVVADMNALSWQECCITAIHTLSSCHQNDAVECSNNHRSGTTTSQGKTPLKKSVQRRKRQTQESGGAVAKKQGNRSEKNGGGGAALALDCVSIDS